MYTDTALILRYKEVQVLNACYNHACKDFVTPLEVVLLQLCHVFINSGIVRLSGVIPIHFRGRLIVIVACITFFTIENIWLAEAGKMNAAAFEFKSILLNSKLEKSIHPEISYGVPAHEFRRWISVQI